MKIAKKFARKLEKKDEELFYNGHTINIKDIRLILDNILNQEETAMECFFSKNYIVNERISSDFNNAKFLLDKTNEAYNLYINGVKGVIYFDDVDEDSVKAKYNNGILSIELVKVDKSAPKKNINIE